MDPRLGAILSLIRYDDHGAWRDIVYQLSPSEMYVPYMNPDQTWSFRAYMDIGEYGFGALASQLHPGADCPGCGCAKACGHSASDVDRRDRI